MLNPVAVADSGPLICLARIHLLGILPGLFSRLLVPPEVWNEATIKGRAHPGAADISQATWISIQEPDPHLVLPLGILLDAGEAEYKTNWNNRIALEGQATGANPNHKAIYRRTALGRALYSTRTS